MFTADKTCHRPPACPKMKAASRTDSFMLTHQHRVYVIRSNGAQSRCSTNSCEGTPQPACSGHGPWGWTSTRSLLLFSESRQQEIFTTLSPVAPPLE